MIDSEQSQSSHYMRRQRSDLSDNFKISCSPEAESYFRRKAESLYDKACRGELDVEVRSDIIQEESEGLKVLPIFSSERFVEDEMEVTDLTEAPSLEVKPVPLIRKPFKRSSYESLYDAANLEKVSSSDQKGSSGRVDDIVLGDRFKGTYEQPKAASSFEKLYCEMSQSNLPADVTWPNESQSILMEESMLGDHSSKSWDKRCS